MSGRLIVLAAGALALAACKKKPAPAGAASKRVAPSASAAAPSWQPFPAGAVTADAVAVTHALYFAPKSKGDPQAAVEACRAAAGLPAAAKLDYRRPTLAEFAPPTPDNLPFIGVDVSAADGQAMQQGDDPLVVAMAAPAADARKLVRAAGELMACAAEATGALVWDEDTRQVFARPAWRELRLAGGWNGEVPLINRHVVIHQYETEHGRRAVTLGMRKLGLPDIVINDAPPESELTGTLINSVADTLQQRGKIERAGQLLLDLDELGMKGAGKQRRVTLQIAVAEPEQGDAENRLLEIRFDQGSGGLHERQVALLEGLFGDAGEQVTDVSDDDPEMLAARDRARAQLAKLAKGFAADKKQGARLLVKAPFATERGDNEWMWVEVKSWHGDTLRGTLVNEPFHVPTLHQGADVTVSQKTLYDYHLMRLDGTVEGGETDQILLRRMEKDKPK